MRARVGVGGGGGVCGGRQGEEKRKTEEERTGGIKRILEERATLRCDGGFSAPLVVNLHSALRRLTGNFPAGLLAACKTPTQSRERAAQGTGGGGKCFGNNTTTRARVGKCNPRM